MHKTITNVNLHCSSNHWLILFCNFIQLYNQIYPKLEKPSNSSRNNFGKITKKELVMTLRNIELLSVLCDFIAVQGTFLHSLNVIEWGKLGKSKFALNSIFTILALC